MSHSVDGLAYQLQPMFDALVVPAAVPGHLSRLRKMSGTSTLANDYYNTFTLARMYLPGNTFIGAGQIKFSSLRRANW